MKTTSIRSIAFSIFLALLGLPGQAAAQGTVPDQLSFQGYIVDGAGAPLGATTPAELPVTFRIFSGATGGTALWAENQTVTFDKGNYSVMLGQGTAAPPGNSSLGTLVKTTQGNELYVETTVTINGSDARILPRMRLLPTPYAFLARNALNADSAAYATTAGSAASANVATFANTAGVATSVDGSGITSGTIPDARLGANVVFKNTTPAFGGITVTPPQGGGSQFSTWNLASGFPSQLVGQWTGGGSSGPQVRYTRANGGSYFDLGMIDDSFVIERNDAPALKIRSENNAVVIVNGLRFPGAEHVLGDVDSSYAAPGNSISFADPGISEDFIGYKNHTFHFRDCLNGGDMSQPNVAMWGKVGIGTSPNPSYSLYVNGLSGGTGSWLASDARYKKAIRSLTNALDVVTRLRGVSYEWRQSEFPEINFGQGRQLGFIAQEAENVLPEVVLTDDKGYRSVAYTQVIPILVEAIKEQQQAAQAKDSRIAALESRLAELEAKERQRADAFTALEAKEKSRSERLLALEALVQQKLGGQRAGLRASNDSSSN